MWIRRDLWNRCLSVVKPRLLIGRMAGYDAGPGAPRGEAIDPAVAERTKSGPGVDPSQADRPIRASQYGHRVTS
jgi:hypothetical protein